MAETYTEVAISQKFLFQEQGFLEPTRNFGQVFQVLVTESQVLLPVRLTGAESVFRGDSIPPLD